MTAPIATSLTEWVAAEIRAELGRQNISGKRLAELVGVSHSWVSYRLTGQQTIDFDDIERIAAALGVPVTRFLPTGDTPVAAS